MTSQKRIVPFSLSPGVKFPDDFKLSLKRINAEFNKTRNHEKYRESIRKLLNLPEIPPLTEVQKGHIGGFIQGDGSISVSAKKSKTSRFGVYFDPEFSATQHVNGSNHLYELLCYFRTGLMSHKNGSNATLVFRIENRKSLQEKVIPFWKQYVYPHSNPVKKERFENWCKLLAWYDKGGHTDLNIFLSEMAPLWDRLRMQKGQSNQSFKNLEEFNQYVLEHVRAKNQKRANLE